MTSAPKDLSLAFADFAGDLLDKESVQSTLEEIVELAVGEIRGCEFAGISLLHKGSDIATPAATHPVVEQADQLQYTTRQGPCLEAINVRDTYFIDDTMVETRWPDFVASVSRLGIRSMMSCQLFTRRDVLGCLNLYSTGVRAFEEGSARVGEVLAAHAAVALSNAQNAETLRGAIRTRERIGEATGILMERYKLTSEQAFALLVKASQNLNTKLRDLAEEIVRTGDFPETTG